MASAVVGGASATATATAVQRDTSAGRSAAFWFRRHHKKRQGDINGAATAAAATTPAEPYRMLRRNGKEVRVRLYTDEPTVAQARAQVQACLDKARAVNDAITVEVPRPHPFAYIYESKLHEAGPNLHAMMALLESVVAEPATTPLSLGFQSIIKVVTATLDDLLQQITDLHRRPWASKRPAKVSIDKLPSVLKLLQLAIALHKAVDTEEDGRIFPSVDEIEADADIRSWRIILSNLEIEPYFQSIGAHYSERLRQFYHLLVRVTAAASHAFRVHRGVVRASNFGFWNFVFTLSYRHAARTAARSLSENNFRIEHLQFLWNLPEQPIVRDMLSAMYTAVAVDTAFSIENPMHLPNEEFWRPPPHVRAAAEALAESLEELREQIPSMAAIEHEPFLRMRMITWAPLALTPLAKSDLGSVSKHATLSDSTQAAAIAAPAQARGAAAVAAAVAGAGAPIASAGQPAAVTVVPLQPANGDSPASAVQGSPQPLLVADGVAGAGAALASAIVPAVGKRPPRFRLFRRKHNLKESMDTLVELDEAPPKRASEAAKGNGRFRRFVPARFMALAYPLLPDVNPTLVIHVHGGGFVAMTSFSHAVYTRRWARDTGVPILSVDYTLAPDAQFPTQIDECYQVYRWALRNALRLGSSAQRIILVGDSAGGNIVTDIVLRAMAEGFRVPDGLILAYPVTMLSPTPSCSRLNSALDPMLHISTLLRLLPLYVPQDHDPWTNVYLSPGVAPDAALKAFPPTRFLVGEFDPLLDDSVHMYRRMKAAGHPDVVMSVRPGLGHGFLNLANVVPDALEATRLISAWITDWAEEERAAQAHRRSVWQSSSRPPTRPPTRPPSAALAPALATAGGVASSSSQLWSGSTSARPSTASTTSSTMAAGDLPPVSAQQPAGSAPAEPVVAASDPYNEK